MYVSTCRESEVTNIAVWKSKIDPSLLKVWNALEVKPVTLDGCFAWLLKRAFSPLDHVVAKKKMEYYQQGPQQSMKAYFAGMMDLSSDVTDYGQKMVDLLTLLAANVRKDLKIPAAIPLQTERSNAHAEGRDVTVEWLLRRLEILDINTPCTAAVQHIRGNRAGGGNARAPRATPIVAEVVQVAQVAAPGVVPVEFQCGVLTDAGRVWLTANNGCFFCRQLGHHTRNCERLAAFQAQQAAPTVGQLQIQAAPQPVSVTTIPSNPILVIATKQCITGVEGGSNKTILNQIKPNSYSEAVCNTPQRVVVKKIPTPTPESTPLVNSPKRKIFTVSFDPIIQYHELAVECDPLPDTGLAGLLDTIFQERVHTSCVTNERT